MTQGCAINDDEIIFSPPEVNHKLDSSSDALRSKPFVLPCSKNCRVKHVGRSRETGHPQGTSSEIWTG